MARRAPASVILAAVLVGALSLFSAAPAQAQRGVLWSGKLTPKDFTGTGRSLGCDTDVSGFSCASLLTDDDFVILGVTYEITRIQLFLSPHQDAGILEIELSRFNGNRWQLIALQVDGSSIGDATPRRDDDAMRWSGTGLSWTADQQVSLSLTVPPPPTVSLAAPSRISEGGGTVSMKVTLSEAPTSSRPIPLQLTSDTLEPGDYELFIYGSWVAGASRSLGFDIFVDAGSTTATLLLRALQDADRDDETFTLGVCAAGRLRHRNG